MAEKMSSQKGMHAVSMSLLLIEQGEIIVQCWPFFSGTESYKTVDYLSSENEKENRFSCVQVLHTTCKKDVSNHSHATMARKHIKNCTKSVTHIQSCSLASTVLSMLWFKFYLWFEFFKPV